MIPGKYDVIPIHASDVASYLRCRRYWDWASPTRNNLRRKIQVYGINTDLWFGTGIHYALEQYYNPALSRNPVEVWETWWNWQWEGGVIFENELEMAYDPTPIENSNGTYRIRGLRDILPDPDHETFLALKELGTGMMTFYLDYAKRNDDFEVIAAETMFSVPLGFEVIDIREQSPNYGKKLEVHARGKRDIILYKPDLDTYGIMDHKTAATVDERYFAKLDMDAQCTMYIWATQEEAKINDLPYKEINWVLYQALRKVYPKPPTLTSRGFPSLDRQKESTTAEMFEALIKSNPVLSKWFVDNEKAQGYYTWLLEMGDKNFIWREYARRNKYEIANFGMYLKEIAKEMLSNPAIYPHPTGDWNCLRCQFRPACLAVNDGSDWQAILTDGYELNRGR